MIKAVIFDLDGTLSYTLDSIAVSGNKALEAIGMEGYETERYKYFCGDGADELVRRLLINNGDKECERFDELKDAYRQYFREYAEYNVKPYDKMPETVKKLKDMGLKLCVLSNKPHKQTIQVVESLYGENVFDFIQGNTKEIRRKPAPDGALLIRDNLEIESDECLYVGDTSTDMQTGNSAGMHTVGVLWGYRTREELESNNAENIIDSPVEIIEIIKQFQGKYN